MTPEQKLEAAMESPNAGWSARFLADLLYQCVYGHIDDARFKDRKTTEMFDWLLDGDLLNDVVVSLDDLEDEWREHDIIEIANYHA